MSANTKILLYKIKCYGMQIIRFINSMSFEEFSKDEKTIAACVFNLSQIGELVGRLDNAFLETNPHIPWRKIKGMRNKIVHDYEGIRLNMVWDVLEVFLPKLIEDVAVIIEDDTN